MSEDCTTFRIDVICEQVIDCDARSCYQDDIGRWVVCDGCAVVADCCYPNYDDPDPSDCDNPYIYCVCGGEPARSEGLPPICQKYGDDDEDDQYDGDGGDGYDEEDGYSDGEDYGDYEGDDEDDYDEDSDQEDQEEGGGCCCPP